jgi:hypothetical protein
MILEPEVDPMFHADSYGYRPGKSALDAVEMCKQRCWRHPWVVDLDIQGFFDNVPHAQILAAVEKHGPAVGEAVRETVACRAGSAPKRQSCRRPVGVLLTETIRAVGLDRALSTMLAPWRLPFAVHDPAKVVADLAVTLALGGDCLADIALLRAEPAVFGLVASDPTVSRTIDRLASDAPAVLSAINAARAATRAQVWKLAGANAPDHNIDAGRPLIVDVDATLVTAHSEKQGAAATFKKGSGYHPLWAFVDHRAKGTGEPLSVLLHPGNAGSNTAADHVTVVREALAQLPGHRPGTRASRKTLIRIDGAGATHELLKWLLNRRLSYSVGFGLPTDFAARLALIPAKV